MEQFGAKNCSVRLTGCLDQACFNAGTCEPTYDEKKDVHGFTCRCMPGYTGKGCETATTGSFNGSSLATIYSNDSYYIQGRYELTFR